MNPGAGEGGLEGIVVGIIAGQFPASSLDAHRIGCKAYIHRKAAAAGREHHRKFRRIQHTEPGGMGADQGSAADCERCTAQVANGQHLQRIFAHQHTAEGQRIRRGADLRQHPGAKQWYFQGIFIRVIADDLQHRLLSADGGRGKRHAN